MSRRTLTETDRADLEHIKNVARQIRFHTGLLQQMSVDAAARGIPETVISEHAEVARMTLRRWIATAPGQPTLT